MLDPNHKLIKLIREDRRYSLDAYVFVFEALRYAQETLGMGSEIVSEGPPDDWEGEEGEEEPRAPRHLTGQQLCEAIRQFALDQYGFMAKCVFNQWGVKSTGDFGEIVFNLINIDEMKKTSSDRREDFDDVFDFDEGLTQRFKMTLPESQ